MDRKASPERVAAERIATDLIHCGIILTDEHTRAMEVTIREAYAGEAKPRLKHNCPCPICANAPSVGAPPSDDLVKEYLRLAHYLHRRDAHNQFFYRCEHDICS